MRVEAYDVDLSFDPPARSFRGVVTVDAVGDGDALVLHAKGLDIASATVDGRAVAHEVDVAAEQLRLPAAPAGARKTRIEFSGRIDPKGLAGMYVSPFGRDGEILTTQLYPAGARYLFPCVDLPAAKATFRVRVEVPQDAAVVFNTDIEATEAVGARKRVRFAPTPRMSTYLLYLGIGPFEETARSDGGLRTIVAHPRGRSAAAAHALDHAGRFLREYESYYAIPYPLPKLHLVAVPSFWAGAMENWGAIAFRETTLLVDERTPAFNRRWARLTLSHEIAHQWFGNLVTNAAWGEFWLNESFATFVATRIIDRLLPGEASWEEFVLRESYRGFSEDALDSTHPVQVELRSPEEIGQIADGITYGKGASILRMIEAYLGEGPFRSGVTEYLNAHRYDIATGADLWNALDRASGEPVSRIMREWITRPGHPMLEVRREGDDAVVSQRRYRMDGRNDPSTWPTPLVVEVDGVAHRTVLDAAPFRVRLPRGSGFRVNPERTGFFHVRYHPPLDAQLLDHWDRLSEIDQWGLLADAYFFLHSGDAALPEFIGLVEKVRRGDRYLPSITTARTLLSLHPFFGPIPELGRAAHAFFRSQFDRLGPSARPGEPPTSGVLRSAVANGMVETDGAFRRAMARSFADDEEGVDRDLRFVAAVAYLKDDGPAAWEEVHRRLAAARSDEEASRYATALPRAPGSSELHRTLELLEGPTLSASRVWDVLRSANGGLEHRAELWRWYARELPQLDARWKGTPLLNMLLPESLPWIGLGRGEEVRSYFAAHPFPSAERGLAEALERLRLREILSERLGAPAGGPARP